MTTKVKQPKRSAAQWTEREQRLAKKYKVKPKMIHMIGEIAEEGVENHLERIKMLLDFAHGRNINPSPSGEPAAATAGTAVEYGPDEPVSEVTKKRLLHFFATLDVRAKLAILLCQDLGGIEGINFEIKMPREKRLTTRIYDGLVEAALACEDPELAWAKAAWQNLQMVIQET